MPGRPGRRRATRPIRRRGSVLGRARPPGSGTQGGGRLGALRPVRSSSWPSTVTPPWRVRISPATPGRCDEPGPLRFCGGLLAALAGRCAPLGGPPAVLGQASCAGETRDERVFRGGTGGGRCVG